MSEQRKRKTHRGRRGKRLNRHVPPGVVVGSITEGGKVAVQSAQPVPAAIVQSLRDRLRAMSAREQRSA